MTDPRPSAAELQRELAVLLVRHQETRRRLAALQATIVDQDARLGKLRARMFGGVQGELPPERDHVGDELREHRTTNASPSRPPEPAHGPEQERDVVAHRPSYVRALRPGLGPVTSGLLALLGGRADPESGQ